jgi:hypothetical protein
VAARTGDARRAIELCRQSVELAQTEWRKREQAREEALELAREEAALAREVAEEEAALAGSNDDAEAMVMDLGMDLDDGEAGALAGLLGSSFGSSPSPPSSQSPPKTSSTNSSAGSSPNTGGGAGAAIDSAAAGAGAVATAADEGAEEEGPLVGLHHVITITRTAFGVKCIESVRNLPQQAQVRRGDWWRHAM